MNLNRWPLAQELKFHAPARTGGCQITTSHAARAWWWFGDWAGRAWVWKFFSQPFRAKSKPYFGWRPLVVVINGRVFHCLQWSARDRGSLSPSIQRKSDRCLRPAICMLARHTNDGSKSSQQEAGRWRQSFAMTSPRICLLSVAMYALSPFRSDREEPSSKILKGKARTLAASLSAWSVLPKLPSETRANLELVRPRFRPRMCNERRAEAERKE